MQLNECYIHIHISQTVIFLLLNSDNKQMFLWKISIDVCLGNLGLEEPCRDKARQWLNLLFHNLRETTGSMLFLAEEGKNRPSK